MYYTGFVSASKNFLAWLRENNVRLAGTTLGQMKIGTRADVLTYAKQDSQKLFNLMYQDLSAPCLNRKRSKFIDFLKLDPYPDKALLARVAEW